MYVYSYISSKPLCRSTFPFSLQWRLVRKMWKMDPEEYNSYSVFCRKVTSVSFIIVHTDRNWSKDGLTTEFQNGTVKCNSTHLTSFAILVSPTGEVEELGLTVVSYVGCSISIISLLLTIILLLALRWWVGPFHGCCAPHLIFFRKKLKKGVLLYIHLNLAVALLLGLMVFVTGIDTATSLPVSKLVSSSMLVYVFPSLATLPSPPHPSFHHLFLSTFPFLLSLPPSLRLPLPLSLTPSLLPLPPSLPLPLSLTLSLDLSPSCLFCMLCRCYAQWWLLWSSTCFSVCSAGCSLRPSCSTS